MHNGVVVYVCLSARFISGTNRRSSLKFGIGDKHSKSQFKLNFGPYRSDITLTLHETQIKLQRR